MQYVPTTHFQIGKRPSGNLFPFDITQAHFFSRRRFFRICTLVTILLSGFLLAGCSDDAMPKMPHMAVGEYASKVEVMTLQGERMPLGTLEGKPLILNVWATWCTPCVKELPSLQKLAEKGDYTVRLVSYDRDDKVVQMFLKEHKIDPNLVLWDPQGMVLREKMMATQLPTTFVIDAYGKIKGAEMGERAWDSAEMISYIDNLL